MASLEAAQREPVTKAPHPQRHRRLSATQPSISWSWISWPTDIQLSASRAYDSSFAKSASASANCKSLTAFARASSMDTRSLPSERGVAGEHELGHRSLQVVVDEAPHRVQ